MRRSQTIPPLLPHRPRTCGHLPRQRPLRSHPFRANSDLTAVIAIQRQTSSGGQAMALRRINKVRARENSEPNRTARAAVPCPACRPGPRPNAGRSPPSAESESAGAPRGAGNTYARLANRGALLCRRSWRISTGIRRPTVALVRTGMTSSTGRRRSWGCVEHPAPIHARGPRRSQPSGLTRLRCCAAASGQCVRGWCLLP